MEGSPVYSIGDALAVCLEDSWNLYLHENARGRTRTWVRQNLVRRVRTTIRQRHDDQSEIYIEFEGYRGEERGDWWWPLENVGPDLYRIPLWQSGMTL